MQISWRGLVGGAAATDFRVGFFIAGVQKGGTYSLYRLLEHHPEIGLSKSKEAHFFDDEVSVNWSNPCYDRFHRVFPKYDRPIFGEATPIYIYWPKSLERIRAYNSNAKLILLLRDPIERAFSAWCHQRRKGRESLSFSEAIREGRSRISDPQGFGNRHFSYVERGFYDRQIHHALSLFPAASLLLLDSRRLSREPQALVRDVARFLGISEPMSEIRTVHANKRAALDAADIVTADDVKLLSDIYAEDVLKLAARVDFPLDRWLTRRYLRGEVSAEDAALQLMQPGISGDGRAKTD